MLADGWTAHAGIAAAALATVRLERGDLEAAHSALEIGAVANGSQAILLHARARIALAHQPERPASNEQINPDRERKRCEAKRDGHLR